MCVCFKIIINGPPIPTNPPPQKHKNNKIRAGYLADKRREIEQGLGSGRLLGVIATNALELGACALCMWWCLLENFGG